MQRSMRGDIQSEPHERIQKRTCNRTHKGNECPLQSKTTQTRHVRNPIELKASPVNERTGCQKRRKQRERFPCPNLFVAPVQSGTTPQTPYIGGFLRQSASVHATRPWPCFSS